jgi:hypothetical protein
MNHAPASPLSYAQVLQNGFGLFKAALPLVFPLTLAGGAASSLPTLLVTDLDGLGILNLLLLASVAVGASLLFYIAALRRMDDVAAHRPPMTLGQVVAGSWSLVLPMLLASLLFALGAGLATLALILPGVFVAVLLCLYPYALVLERAAVVDSLRRSARLVWGHWWLTFGLMLTVLLIHFGVLFLALRLFVGGDAVQVETGPAAPQFAEMLVTTLVSALMSPLMYAVMLVLYRGLQAEKAGQSASVVLDPHTGAGTGHS